MPNHGGAQPTASSSSQAQAKALQMQSKACCLTQAGSPASEPTRPQCTASSPTQPQGAAGGPARSGSPASYLRPRPTTGCSRCVISKHSLRRCLVMKPYPQPHLNMEHSQWHHPLGEHSRRLPPKE